MKTAKKAEKAQNGGVILRNCLTGSHREFDVGASGSVPGTAGKSTVPVGRTVFSQGICV